MPKILIIGDSFVEGVGGRNTKGWAHQVAHDLPSATCEISGEGGDNTTKVIARWPPGAFDLVVIQVGTNDSRFRPSLKGHEVPAHRFSANLGRLKKLATRSNKKCQIVFVGLFFVDETRTVPYKEDKIYQNASLAKYDALLAGFAKTNRLEFVSLKHIPKTFNAGLMHTTVAIFRRSK